MKIKLLQLFMLSVLIVLVSGCAGNRDPQIKQYNSGAKMSNDWKAYNEYAKENNEPILDFVATSLIKPPKNGLIPNFDTFNIDDKDLYVSTKLHDVNKDDLLEFKFYQPDGRLYHYYNYRYKWNTKKWIVWTKLPIKDYYTEKNIGQWKVDIYIKGKKAKSKTFNIGTNTKQAQATNTNLTIGVFPYYDSELSRWKHSMAMAYHVATGLQYHKKNIKAISPKMILNDLVVPTTNYKSFENYIKEDLKSSSSIIIDLAKKYNMDYAILGKAQSTSGHTLDTKVTTYLIDINSKEIKTFEVQDVISRGQVNMATQWHKLRLAIYEKALQDFLPTIKNLK